jgi:fatty-acid peroxygenase
MPQVPRDKSPGSSLALFPEGYNFTAKRFRRYRSDIFETRLMLLKAVCMRGEEAAKIFYDEGRFQPQGTLPRRGLESFLGEGGVQTLDGDAHRRRKAMFMSLMTPESTGRLVKLTADEWRASGEHWEGMKRVVLFYEVGELLCRVRAGGRPAPRVRGQKKDAGFRDDDRQPRRAPSRPASARRRANPDHLRA